MFGEVIFTNFFSYHIKTVFARLTFLWGSLFVRVASTSRLAPLLALALVLVLALSLALSLQVLAQVLVLTLFPVLSGPVLSLLVGFSIRQGCLHSWASVPHAAGFGTGALPSALNRY